MASERDSARAGFRAADCPPCLRLLKKKLFASWDRFMVPYPLSRGLFLWGPPLWVPRDADATELELKRVELEELLNRVTAQADEAVSRRS